MSAFYRFPSTPHLAWLGAGKPRDGKALTSAEMRELLSSVLFVEEKVDGANLGLSVDEQGQLRGQNRGSYLDLDSPTGQWKPLKRWLSTRRHKLVDALSPNLIIFGEWCYAVHSVHYTHLPDWFLAFDVYDRSSGAFWSVQRRDEFAARLELVVVPALGRGHFDLTELKKLLGPSALTDGPAEGIYVRRERNGRLLQRAKLVRPEFVQAIDEHWSKRPLKTNELDAATKDAR